MNIIPAFFDKEDIFMAYVRPVWRDLKVGADLSFVFANSAGLNTQKTAIITKPGDPVNKYKVSVYNPSTASDLTVKVFNIENSLGGGDRDCYLTSFVIPKAQTVTGTAISAYDVLIEGLFYGGNVKLVVSNGTALGVAEGFTATARIRETI